jgi:hypothetical protein
MQIERELAGHVVCNHGFVHVHSAFRSPGGAAGEMQQGHVFRLGRNNFERLRCLRQGGDEIDRVRRRIGRTFDQKDMPEAG